LLHFGTGFMTPNKKNKSFRSHNMSLLTHILGKKKSMLNDEQKKDFAAKLAKIRDNASNMLALLEYEKWDNLVDAGYEMDSQMDLVYDHLTTIMIERGYSL
jgi:hypothetical protein